MRNAKKAMIIIFLIFLLVPATVVMAEETTYTVNSGEFTENDLFVATENISNEGTVKGDLIAAGSSVSSNGTIEGDYLCIGSKISLAGKILGNMRAAGQQIVVSGEIGKNVNCFAQDLVIDGNTVIGGNSLLAAQNVDVAGITKGYSKIYGQKIILRGEFFGDVDVNLGSPDEEMSKDVTLTVAPGAKIHGTLSYKSVSAADISPQAQISETNWAQAKADISGNKPANTNYLSKFIKIIFTTAIYFLFGLLLYKLFPNFFKKLSENINEKPLAIFGRGLITIITPIVVLLCIILLFILSAWVISPSIGFLLMTVFTGFYALLFYLAAIPVSLWLGTKLFKEKFRVPYTFGLGLVIITAIDTILDLLSSFSGAFSILSFILSLAILIFGVGSLIYGIRNSYSSLKQDSELNTQP